MVNFEWSGYFKKASAFFLQSEMLSCQVPSQQWPLNACGWSPQGSAFDAPSSDAPA